MKNDGWLGRNYLQGVMGNRVNALLSASGENLRKLLRHLARKPGAAFYAALRWLIDPLSTLSAHHNLVSAQALSGSSGTTT